MTTWRGALTIVRWELSRDKFMYVSCFVLAASVALFFLGFARLEDMNGDDVRVGNFSVNMMVILMLQMLGLGINRDYLSKYWKTDHFIKRSSLYKQFAITDRQIILARYMRFGFVLVYMSALLFSFMTLDRSFLESLQLSGWTYIQFTLIWIGYAIAMGNVYLYLEMVCSGRAYYMACFIAVGIMMVLVGVLTFALRVTVWNVVAGWVHAVGWLAPLGMIGGGIGASLLTMRLMAHKMKRRDWYM